MPGLRQLAIPKSQKVFYRGGCGKNAAMVRRKAPGSEVGLCDAPDASRVDDGWVLGADP